MERKCVLVTAFLDSYVKEGQPKEGLYDTLESTGPIQTDQIS